MGRRAFSPSGGSRWSNATLRRQSEDPATKSPEDFMSTRTGETRNDGVTNGARTAPHRSRRLSTEAKAAFQTTGLLAVPAVLVGILIAAAVIDETDAGGFGARQAWLYVTILTVGYMVSRGLAKSGSRAP